MSTPERDGFELDIKPGDLDIIDHNILESPGDIIADYIEEMTSPLGSDDGDSLGVNDAPSEWQD